MDDLQFGGAPTDAGNVLDRAAKSWRKGAASVQGGARPRKKTHELAALKLGSMGGERPFGSTRLDEYSSDGRRADERSDTPELPTRTRKPAPSAPPPLPPPVASPPPGSSATESLDSPPPAKRTKRPAESESSWVSRADGNAGNSSPSASKYGASELGVNSVTAESASGAMVAGSESLRAEEACAAHANMIEELRELRGDLPGGEQLANMLAEAFSDGAPPVARKAVPAARVPAAERSAGRASRVRGVVSVLHASGAAPAVPGWSGREYLSLKRVRELNFALAHGINFTDRDRIDLEHTSCESGCESDDCEVRASSGLDSEAVELQRARELVPAGAARSLSTGRAPYDMAAQTYFGARPDDDDDDELLRSRRRKRKRTPGRMRQSTLSGGFADESSSFRGGGGRRAGVASTAGRMNSCFLCRWGKHEHDVVNNEHMEALLRMIYENIGEIPPEYIALAVHMFYMRVLRPAAARAGQRLPVWRSREIFICITTHNQDPQMRLARDLQKLEVVQQAIEGHIFYRQPPPDTGGGAQLPGEAALGLPPPAAAAGGGGDEKRFEVNLKAVQALQGVMRMKYLISGIKLPAMAFYQSRRDIKLGADRQFYKGIALKDTRTRRAAASRLRK